MVIRKHWNKENRKQGLIIDKMVCSNVWGTTRFNFEATTLQSFLADLFLISSDFDIGNLTVIVIFIDIDIDDNTPYLSAKHVEDVKESLEQASVSLFRWFETNLLKSNADKCHFLVSTRSRSKLKCKQVLNKKQ